MRVVFSVVISVILAAVDCLAQEADCCFGINLFGLAKGNLTIHSGYAFKEHWSLSSDISIGYSRLKKTKTDIEAVHDGEFVDSRPILSEPPDLMTEHIRLIYWPADAMSGTFLATGIRHGSSTGIDFTLGIGYVIPIWKGMRMTAAYTYALKSMTSGLEKGLNGIDIYLSYTF